MNIYRDEILEHYKDPQNFRKIEDPTYTSKFVNPFCGDDIETYIVTSCKVPKAHKEERIEDISFLGKGCAISIAAASMLTEFVKGKSMQELKAMSEQEMLELLDVEISESRKKCALLAFDTMKDAIK